MALFHKQLYFLSDLLKILLTTKSLKKRLFMRHHKMHTPTRFSRHQITCSSNNGTTFN